ncbi:MAG: hypothetical protein GC152_15670 [Alphaproteobacteria bacterium]|nr:hypothetical protein [Alphaproteobacteria bacterium]
MTSNRPAQGADPITEMEAQPVDRSAAPALSPSRVEEVSSADAETKVSVILAEYAALREELMYFLSSSRQYTTFQITTGFGQIGGVGLLYGEEVSVTLVLLIYLFGFPTLNFLLAMRTLESTSKILVIADYIHKGIKPQLARYFGPSETFFDWEEHKAASNRVDPTTLLTLDRFKWFVFIFAMLISFGTAFGVFIANVEKLSLTSIIAGAAPSSAPLPGQVRALPDVFFLSLALICAAFAFLRKVSRTFDEVRGECYDGDR